MEAGAEDLPAGLTAAAAAAAARLGKTIAGLVENGGQSLTREAVAAASAREIRDLLAATGGAMTELGGPVGAAFAPTGRFLNGAVERMPLSEDSAPSPLDVARRLLKRQKNIDFGDIGKTPPPPPTLQSSPPPVGDVY